MPFKRNERFQRQLKTEGNANGPVITYFLSKEELAPYDKLKPPTDSDGKKLRRGSHSGGVA